MTQCESCGASALPDAQFCEACGMALPSATVTTPRVVDAKGFATTTAGQRLQSEELHKQQKKAAGALLGAACLTTLQSVIGYVVVMNLLRGRPMPPLSVVTAWVSSGVAAEPSPVVPTVYS